MSAAATGVKNMSENPQAVDNGTEQDESIEMTTDRLAPNINRAQGLANSLKNELPPTYTREVEHLETDLEVLERWTDDADDEGVEALAGASTVVDTAQIRIEYLQNEIGDADQGIATRLENLEEAFIEIEAVVNGIEIKTTAYVVYVNRSFADRHFDAQVSISTMLISGLEGDVEDIEGQVNEFGLFPMDGLFGQSVEDLAFPANWDTDLSEEHRTYWTSTSDGGKIA